MSESEPTIPSSRPLRGRAWWSVLPLFRPSAYFYGVVALLLLLQAIFEPNETPAGLLLLLSVSIVAAIIVNGLLATLTLRRVSANLQLPASVTAGERFEIEVEISNRRFLSGLPLVSVSVHGGRGFHERIGTYMAAYVGARAREIVHTKAVFLRRGTQRLHHVRLSTAFPFGLMCASRIFLSRNLVVVFPRPLPLPGYLYRALLIGGVRGKGDVRERGGSDELYGLRRYVDGDPLSHLHWRTTARVGEPMVILHEEQHQRDYRIILDTWVGEASQVERQTLERLISLASGALNYLHGRGARVGYRQANPSVLVVEEERGAVAKHRILGELADLGYSSSPLTEWSRRAFEGLRPDDLILIFTMSAPETLRGVVSTTDVPVEIVSMQDPFVLDHLRSLGRYSLQTQDHEEPEVGEADAEGLEA